MPVTSKQRRFLRRARFRLAAGLALLLCLCAGGVMAAGAHDYWLEPGSPYAARGDELALHLWLGERLKGEEERPLQKERTTRFDLFGDRSGRHDLLTQGKEGQIPVAKVRLESASALAVMDRAPKSITIEPDKFNEYLKEEGADAVIAQRAAQNQTAQPGRELFSRYLKSLIQQRDPAAATPNTLYKRRVGQRLEILLQNDPSRLRPDGRLAVKVWFDDRPLAGAKVFACRRAATEGQPPVILTATTDGKGLADFTLDQPGLWLVRLVHLRPASSMERKGENGAQWESFWAEYTFGARMVAGGAASALPGASASPAANPREHRPPQTEAESGAGTGPR